MDDSYKNVIDTDSCDTEFRDSRSEFYESRCEIIPNNFDTQKYPKTPQKPSSTLATPPLAQSITQTPLNPQFKSPQSFSKPSQKPKLSRIPKKALLKPRNGYLGLLGPNSSFNFPSIAAEKPLSHKFLSQDQISQNLALSKIDHDICSYVNKIEKLAQKGANGFGPQGRSTGEASFASGSEEESIHGSVHKSQDGLIRVHKIDLNHRENEEEKNEYKVKLQHKRYLKQSAFVTAQKKKLKGNSLFMKTYDDSKTAFEKHKKEMATKAMDPNLQVVNYAAFGRKLNRFIPAKKCHSISTPNINKDKIESGSLRGSDTVEETRSPPSVVYQKLRIKVSKNHTELRGNSLFKNTNKILKSKYKKSLPALAAPSKALNFVKNPLGVLQNSNRHHESLEIPSREKSRGSFSIFLPSQEKLVNLHQSSSEAAYASKYPKVKRRIWRRNY
ncbi:unnamed protein product [Moneuplotes crassus]|uniref:Uncharacterized protein n=1 Tax=Euplotes crassus TaxID=5936 RepID=A0AAD1XCM5_EUPCR|nr:unnamed protein product [Moneuplotes crassus]